VPDIEALEDGTGPPAGADDDPVGAGDPAGADDDEVPRRAWRRLVRTVQLEALALVAALAVTAALVAVTPARTDAAIAGVAAFNAPMASGGELNVTLTPAEVGSNVAHLQYVDQVGRPLGDIRQVTVELTRPGADLGPITTVASQAGPGHFIADGLLVPMPGAWELTVVTRIGQFDQDRNRFPVTIG
jgi:copper transport protein